MKTKLYTLIFLALVAVSRLGGRVEPADASKAEVFEDVKPAGTVPLEKSPEHKGVFLGEFLQPWESGDPNELVAFDFDNAELTTLIRYVEERYKIICILDDIINPVPQGGKSVGGIKISFKTNKPLPKKEAWSLFVTFLEMSGLSIVPGPGPDTRTYRIITADPRAPSNANREPLPTFIGTNLRWIPDNDVRIRYVYFVRNVSIEVVKSVLDTIRGASTPPLIIFPDIGGILITDRAANIRSMLEIVNALEESGTPEAMSIIKLEHTDANKIAEFYKTIAKEEDMSLAARLMGGRRTQTLSYFPQGIRVIPEPRTNRLILLGPAEGNKKVADFIIKELDKQNTLSYRLTKVYPLKFVQAKAAAVILNNVVKFKEASEAAKSGGVRDGDKYFKPVSIVSEDTGNRLIITADYEEHLKLQEVITKIDVEQPQVALKVFLVEMDITDNMALGVQMRDKKPGVSGLISNSVNYQSAELGSIVERVAQSTSTPPVSNTGTTRLLGDLISLATGGVQGSTYITLGVDAFGVWGILRMLETHTNSHISSNPFLVTANNYPAILKSGETRYVITGITQGSGGSTPSFGDRQALLEVSVTPRISYEGYITLDITINDNNFTSPDINPTDPTTANRIERQVKTSAIVANNETIVLGGLIRESFQESIYESMYPLSKIPIIGWLFKNKTKTKTRTSLLVFISPEILPVTQPSVARDFTAEQLADVQQTIMSGTEKSAMLDPINRWFFDEADRGQELYGSFVEKEGRYLYPHQRKGREATRVVKTLGDFL